MHKTQSLTLPYCIIDPRATFCMKALYVAFSRSPSLDRIALIAPLTANVLNKYVVQKQKIMNRLTRMEAMSSPLEPFELFIQHRESVILDRVNGL